MHDNLQDALQLFRWVYAHFHHTTTLSKQLNMMILIDKHMSEQNQVDKFSLKNSNLTSLLLPNKPRFFLSLLIVSGFGSPP